MQHDLKETLEAVSDIANSDESLKSICLSDRHAKLMAGVAAAETGTKPAAAAPVGGGSGEAAQPVGLMHSSHMRMANTILETYEFKLESTHVRDPFPPGVRLARARGIRRIRRLPYPTPARTCRPDSSARARCHCG